MIRKFNHKITGLTIVVQESISMPLVENSKVWEEIFEPKKEIEIPTVWFKSHQIETWVGETDNGTKDIEEVNGGRAMLIVQHQCGENKEWLIDQLKYMITYIKTDGEGFAG
tara:strand:+ start:387 stop:719 length:333 start_codon:yes stop_codon:yes gene_type:complete